MYAEIVDSAGEITTSTSSVLIENTPPVIDSVELSNPLLEADDEYVFQR